MKPSRIVALFGALLVVTLVVAPSPALAFGLAVVAAVVCFAAEQEERAVSRQQVHQEALNRIDNLNKSLGTLNQQLEAHDNRLNRIENRTGRQ